MAKNLSLELILKARDYASRVVQSVAQRTQQINQQVAQSTQRSAATQQGAISQTARVGEQAARTGVASARRLAQAREGLGMRSERQIQQEINRTIAQYNRLKNSGSLSYRELARAGELARNRIRELNAEMGRTPVGQRLGNIAKGVVGVVGGVMAAKHIITPAMNDRKQWDTNVTNVALQAFGDKDEKYIQGEGVKQIQQAVLSTVKNVGGTHDQALGNLNAMMVNGMSFDQANAMLAQAQMMQVAGEASSDDVGALIKVLSDYGFKGDELTKAFEHALRSGMDGKFEIKDMVGALPDILATASNAGFKGMKDFDYVLSWLQSAADKSGSNSEAANNVKNTLNKMTAADTLKRFEDIENPFLKGKGIDLKQSLLDGKARGLNPVEVVSEIAEKLLTKESKYQALQQKLKTAGNEEEKANIESQISLMKGFILSQLLPDVQAKAGLNAAIDKEAMKPRQDNLNDELTGGLNSKRFNVMSQTDQAVQARAESLTFLGEGVSSGLTGAERRFNDWKIKTAKENPELFSVISNVATALEAVAAGAGVAAVALWGLGGRDNGGSLLERFGRDPLSRRTGANRPLPRTSGASSSAVMGGSAGAGRLGKLFSVGSKALSGLSFISMAQTLGEQQPYVQAKQEMEDEKREPMKQKFAQSYAEANKSHSSMNFTYGGFPMGKSSQGEALYGGYALAALNHDDNVARARYEMGGYDEQGYQQRLARNEQQRLQYITPLQKQVNNEPVLNKRETAAQVTVTQPPFAQSFQSSGLPSGDGKPYQVANSSQGIANSMGSFALSLAEATLQQGVMQGQLDSVVTTLAQYQVDFAAFGQTISDGLQAGLAAQSHTIDNKVVVELDGRVVAENVSQYFFTMANRG